MKVLVSRAIVPGGVGISDARHGEIAVPSHTDPDVFIGIETGKPTTTLLVVEKDDEKVAKKIQNFLERNQEDPTFQLRWMRAGKTELNAPAATEGVLKEIAAKVGDHELDTKVYVTHNHRLFKLNLPAPVDMSKTEFTDQAKWEAQAKKMGLEIYQAANFGREPNKTIILAARKPDSKNIKYGEFKLGASGVLYKDPLAFRRDRSK